MIDVECMYRHTHIQIHTHTQSITSTERHVCYQIDDNAGRLAYKDRDRCHQMHTHATIERGKEGRGEEKRKEEWKGRGKEGVREGRKEGERER